MALTRASGSGRSPGKATPEKRSGTKRKSRKQGKSEEAEAAGGDAGAAATEENPIIPGKYKFKEHGKSRGQMIQHSRAEWVNEIGQTLTPTNWQRIKEGPFGTVLKMVRRVKCSAHLMHVMLFNQVQTLKKHETWYKVRGKYARFSLKEFAHISRLNCSTPNPVDMVDDMDAVKAFFGGLMKVKVGQYKLLLQAQGESSDKLKLAHLMGIEGVILGTDKNHYIRPWVVKLLEDMDKFYAFPWGRVAYNETHKSWNRSVEFPCAKGLSL